MEELIEEAIKEFVENNKQINMAAPSIHKDLAEHINLYIIRSNDNNPSDIAEQLYRKTRWRP